MAHARSEFKRGQNGHVSAKGKVAFDVWSETSDFGYNSSTGEIIFNVPGMYSVEWWVATETAPRGTAEFELVPENGESIPGCSPIKTGQVSGFGIIDVKSANTKLWLASKSDYKIIFSLETSVKAYMQITQIDNTYPQVYHANLSSTGRFFETTIGNIVYRLQYADGVSIAMFVRAVENTVVVDIKRSSQYGTGGVEGQSLNNFNLTTTLQPMDGTIYFASNEMQRTWIRQKDPVSGLWSMHEVDLFASNAGTRVSICVFPIYENIDLTGL